MSKPVVFVSYSHKDEDEKEHLVSHLKVLKSAGVIDLWVDDRIEGGADWEAEIKQAIAQAKVAILMISANFLTSSFILGKEVPAFLERREQEGMTVFPIIAKACSWEHFEWLNRMNVRPKNARPIWSGTAGQIDEDLAKIAQEVAVVATRDDAAQSPAAVVAGNDPGPPLAEAGQTPPANPTPTLSDQDREHLEKMLDTNTRRLYKLQQQAAVYGISTPPEIQIQIEDLEIEIAKLKQQLR